jgi:CRISPR-associated endonuclease/helicase Cas3
VNAPLEASDFPAFFKELWSYDPYDWQSELVTQVLKNRRWPSLVDRPTGTGKTALLDAATFVLAVNALEADNDPSLRWMPTRTIMVVDRRIVVDQAGFRGAQIAEKLALSLALDSGASATSVARRVAEALLTLSAGPSTSDHSLREAPMAAGILRGGITRDESWATRPDRPALLISTVDQVGSRLLFQGYGLGRGAKPLHAGLLGNDTLIILDEVQLSVPFAETLGELTYLQRPNDTEPVNRFHVTEMSATPRSSQIDAPRAWVFPDPAANSPMLGDAAIQQRVQAEKEVTLVHYAEPKDTDRLDQKFAETCAKELERLLPQTKGAGGTFGVIVNRVATAVRIANLLETKGTVHLLTGRMRPYDKDRVLTPEFVEQLTDRTKRVTHGTPTFIVGTQTLEAGADFDFDGLVTECASRSALVQRFGRVDRAGILAAAGQPSKSAIIPRVASFEDDPVYGNAIGETWKWLNEISTSETVNFAVGSIPSAGPDAKVDPEPAFAPLTEPHHLDLWAHTSQPPAILPDVASRLHGLGERSFDINVVWRADVTEQLLGDKDPNGLNAELNNRLKAVPPRSGECLQISMRAATAWLREIANQGPVEKIVPKVYDAEGAQEQELPRAEHDLAPYAILEDEVWKIDDDYRSLRPGVTIVVPCRYGGLDPHFNWDPTSAVDVPDVAEEVALERGQVVVRLDPSLAEGSSGKLKPERARASVVELLSGLSEEFDDVQVAKEIRRRILDLKENLAAVEPDPDTPAAEAIDVLVDAASLVQYEGLQVVLVKGGAKPIAVARWRIKEASTSESGKTRVVSLFDENLEDDDDERSFLTIDASSTTASEDFPGGQVALRYHLRGVGSWALKFASNLSLPALVQRDLEIAGLLHDLGKADPRFQAWLNGGSQRIDASLIAKSKDRNDDARTRRLAKKQSGYPKGMRHEVLSLAMIEDISELREQANDWELVCHLVASHHGWCRPFSPAQRDQRPVIATAECELHTTALSASTAHGLDAFSSTIGERYWSLTDRYGWFQLAWYESILRLADHTESREESRILAGRNLK